MIEAFGSYRLSDFLLFSRETLFEIYQTYNGDYWPLQYLWVAGTAIILLILLRPSRIGSRILFPLLAGYWVWVAAVFQGQYFLSINWAAKYFALLFVIESLLLLVFSLLMGILDIRSRWTFSRAVGICIFVCSVAVPVELLWGQPLSQVLIFGWGADRTAIGSIGIFLCLHSHWSRWLLLIPPVVWLVFASLMYLGLNSP